MWWRKLWLTSMILIGWFFLFIYQISLGHKLIHVVSFLYYFLLVIHLTFCRAYYIFRMFTNFVKVRSKSLVLRIWKGKKSRIIVSIASKTHWCRHWDWLTIGAWLLVIVDRNNIKFFIAVLHFWHLLCDQGRILLEVFVSTLIAGQIFIINLRCRRSLFNTSIDIDSR